MAIAIYNAGVAELGRKNQANGYVGIDANGVVQGMFAQRFDTAANIAAIVLANGELAYTADTMENWIGDGVTAGGLFRAQLPIRQGKIYAANTIVSSPADVDSLLFAKTLGATYRLRLEALFTADASNTSNFAVQVKLRSGVLSLENSVFAVTGKSTWFDASAAIETKNKNSVVAFGEVTYTLALTGSNLTLDAASVSAEFVFKLSSTAGSQPTIAIAAIPRTGASTAATCNILAELTRIK